MIWSNENTYIQNLNDENKLNTLNNAKYLLQIIYSSNRSRRLVYMYTI